MNVLIIGGTRFIGAHLAKTLLDLGHQVTLLNRGEQTPLFHLDAETIRSNRSKLLALRPQLERRGFDAAIDMIPMNTEDINQTIDALDGIVPRICLISSMDVYLVRDILFGLDPSPIHESSCDEEAPLRHRLFPYHHAFKPGDDLYRIYDKIPAEAKLQTISRSDWTICRLPAVYGPGDYQHRLHYFTKRYRDGRSTILMNDGWANWRWTWGYVEEVARAIAAACIEPNGANQIFNIGELDAPSFRERVELIARILDWPLEIVESTRRDLPSSWSIKKLNFKQHWIADTSKARTLLGYRESLDLEESFRKAVEWELENPPSEFDERQFEYEAEDRFLPSSSNK